MKQGQLIAIVHESLYLSLNADWSVTHWSTNQKPPFSER